MPELPDIALYLEALRARIDGRRLERSRVSSPFLLRSVEPRLDEAHGASVVGLARLGKRIAIGFDNDLWLVIHLMVAGRLQWRDDWLKTSTKQVALTLGFDSGSLLLTEAGTKKRASLYVVRGQAALAQHDPGGVDVASVTAAELQSVLQSRNHTLKRALTDPRLVSGVGNAYSDEILHRAQLSPVALTSKLTSADYERLLAAMREVVDEWLVRLRDQAAGDFPRKVTAFHEAMAVHGRFGEPCPKCGTKVQRTAMWTTRPTTVRAARRAVGYSPIGRYRGC